MVHERAARGVTTVLAQELHSKSRDCRKDNGKDRKMEEEEKDVSSYRTSLTKRKDTGNLKE
jgi:hypothetical protein